MEDQFNENDFFDYDYEQVEASANFVPVKTGTYMLKIDEVEVGPRRTVEPFAPEDDDRLIAKIRHSLVSTEGVETMGQGTPGGIFNRLWLHTPKALPFLRVLVEAHGGNWTEFSQALKAQKGRPFAEALQELLGQYVGATAEAKVKLITKDRDGEELTNPRNEITKYIVTVNK